MSRKNKNLLERRIKMMAEDRIVLLLTGDVMLGGEFLPLKDQMGLRWEYPFEKIKVLFEGAEIIFGNLECPLFTSKMVRNTDYILYAPNDSLSALKYLGYNVLSVGNNHIMDYGNEGLQKTIETLHKNEIASFGAGMNSVEAGQGLLIEKKGLKIAFLGYSTFEEPREKPVYSPMAGQNGGGCVPYELKRIEKDIERNKNNADVICISLHWGYEYYLYPSPEQIELAHRIIDAGAHIIVGHHPHVVQGFERYNQGIIFYSLGNFFFPDFRLQSGVLYQYPKESNRFIIVRCEISDSGVKEIKVFHGVRDQHYQLIVLVDKEKQRSIAKMRCLSKKISMVDYRIFWQTYSANKEKKRRILAALKRTKELGISGCAKKLLVVSIKHVGRLLPDLVKCKLRKILKTLLP